VGFGLQLFVGFPFRFIRPGGGGPILVFADYVFFFVGGSGGRVGG
jgi:hypothetical protein